jgi:hypothetical protein
MGRNSVVGISTRFGLNGPGIESWWGAIFSAPVQSGPVTHTACCTVGRVSFPRVQRPGRCFDHPSPIALRVMKEQRYSPTLPLGLHGLF